MDKITTGLLTEFSEAFGINELDEAERFEQLAAYITVRQHFSEATFNPGELVTGSGGDCGIDAVAIIVNNNLITDKDAVVELLEINKFLDVTFIFVQAERSPKFDGAKINNFGYGVRDLLGSRKLSQNAQVKAAAEIIDFIFENSGRFTQRNPFCFLYYVTTGVWKNDPDLLAKINSESEALRNLGYFTRVEFTAVGADLIQKLFNQTKNAISREFVFSQKCTAAYDIANVEQAHFGYLPALEYLKLVCDDQGKIIQSLFYENVRDWIGYQEINNEIRETLNHETKDRFLLMNNGVTIIARSLRPLGHKFTMSGFSVVNGCQTSHVLADNRELLSEKVNVPVRIIHTQDEAVMEAIITATNRQTEVKSDQFFALKPFAKKLEAYFAQLDPEHRLYYERRSHQYDDQNVLKKRIVPHQNLVRSMGAMFLLEPHRTTKNYRLLAAKVGKDIFMSEDRLEPYYVAAYALFRLESLFGNKLDPALYKPARYQILLAARLIMDPDPIGPLNSLAAARRGDAMAKRLWLDADDVLVEAAKIVNDIAKGEIERDSIRTEKITEDIIAALGKKPKASEAV